MQGKLNRRDLLKATVGATVAPSVLSPGQRIAKAFAQSASSGTYYWRPNVGPGDPYWAVVQRGVQAAGKALGVKAVFEGPSGYSPPKQADMVNAAISAKAAGIVTTSADPAVMKGPLQRAAQAGIPTILSHTPPPKDLAAAFASVNPIAFVRADVSVAAARASAKLGPLLPKAAERVAANDERGHPV